MYPRPTLSALRESTINDVETALGGPLLPQSIMRVLASTEAGLVFQLYGYLDWIAKQSVPFTATGEFLESWANLKGVYRIPATAATGTCSFTGEAGFVVPAGSIIATANNIQYATNSDFIVGTTPNTSFTAVVPAAAGNAASGVGLTLVTPILGVNSQTTASTAIVGGSEQQSNDSLRSNMLQVYQNPSEAGAATDYKRWALEVPGCTRAWVNTFNITSGAVQVFVMFDNTESQFGGFPQGTDGGATDEWRIDVATGDQLLVANHIYPVRPVTALVLVSAPTPTPINFVIQSLNPGSIAVQSAVIAALQDCFLRLGSPLNGNIIYPSSTNQAIESAAGVGVYTLVSPVTPIQVPLGSLPTVGTVSFI